MRDEPKTPGPIWAQIALPLILVLVLLVAVLAHYLPLLPAGELTEYDEYHTLDRSLSILSHGHPWTVYSLNEPSFRKPPLQYWFTAFLLKSGVPDLLALRTFSLLCGLGTLVLTGLLALKLVPRTPAAAVAAIVILAGSPMFWDLATSALLDSGAAFFVTASALALLAALDRPRLIWLVALLIGLGALQKSPAAAVTVAAMLLTLRYTNRESLAKLWSPGNRRLRRHALWLALAITFGWTALQTILHGIPAISESIVQEMLGRFAPGAPSTAAENGASWVSWLWRDAPWLWGPAILATLALPALIRQPAATAIPGWLGLFFLGMTLAGGNIYARYLLLALPFLAAALAAVLVVLLRQPLLGLAAAIVLSTLSGGTFLPIGQRVSSMHPFMPIMGRFESAVQPDDTLIACNWTREGRRIYPGAMSVFASAGKPFTSLKRDPTKSLARDLGTAPPPYRGLCAETDLPILQAVFAGFTVLDRDAGMAHWTATGVTP